MSPSKGGKRKSEVEALTEAAEEFLSSPESKRQRRLPVRAKDDEPAAKGTLKVFGDDDDAEPMPAISTEKIQVAEQGEQEDSSDDDDDEAPEAVSTAQAASQVKKSAQTAQKLAQEKAAEKKRKRQERDALFKSQAEERKKEEEEAKARTAERTAQNDADAQLNGLGDADPRAARKRLEKMQVPTALPAEFLTDPSSDEEDEDEDMDLDEPRPKNRTIVSIDRKLSRKRRGPRDARVGSTVYRVSKKTDERMTPKLKKHSLNRKQMLLQRNRAASTSRSGFFAKR